MGNCLASSHDHVLNGCEPLPSGEEEKNKSQQIIDILSNHLTPEFKVYQYLFIAMCLELWSQGQIKVLQALRSAGYDITRSVIMEINRWGTNNISTPLDSAIYSKNLECVKYAKEIGIEFIKDTTVSFFDRSGEPQFEVDYLIEVFKIYPLIKSEVLYNDEPIFRINPEMYHEYRRNFKESEIERLNVQSDS